MTNFHSLKKLQNVSIYIFAGWSSLINKNKRQTGNERQGGGMAVWYVNSRTPPPLWHPSQMACQIGCRSQISLPGPRSWNITRVDAEAPWPVGKYTVRPDCALISTAHPVISARRPSGNMTPLILSAFSLLWVCTFYPARPCKVKVLYPVWTNLELKAKSKWHRYLLMLL